MDNRGLAVLKLRTHKEATKSMCPIIFLSLFYLFIQGKIGHLHKTPPGSFSHIDGWVEDENLRQQLIPMHVEIVEVLLLCFQFLHFQGLCFVAQLCGFGGHYVLAQLVSKFSGGSNLVAFLQCDHHPNTGKSAASFSFH